MAFMDKFKEFVNPIDDEEDEEEVEEYEPVEEEPQQAQPVATESAAYYEKPKAKNNSATLQASTKMVLFEPRSNEDAEIVGMRLKEGRAVVVNLHRLDRTLRMRTVDFLTGVVFALDGKLQVIGDKVILCSPKTIGVEGEISLTPEVEADEEE